MKMNSLKKLHEKMALSGLEIQQFSVRMGAISFDCLFSIRDKPDFVLSLTSRGENPKFFKFVVIKGNDYEIRNYFDGFYLDLAKLLNVGAGSWSKLIPENFLEELNSKIPTDASLAKNPTNESIIRLRHDITEERDLPYFDTWTYWKEKSPSEENMQKTLIVLGDEALDHSVKNNASSRWSAIDKKNNWRKQ